MALRNPYDFAPASEEHFVGREDIFGLWRERLNSQSESWKTGKSWIVVGPGGVGKTSLLKQMEAVARKEREAHTLYVDMGHFRELDSPADFFSYLEGNLPRAQRVGTRIREWFGLQPDASMETMGRRIAQVLLKQAVAISPVQWNGLGIEISGPEIQFKSSDGITSRLVTTFNNLAVLSEEQNRPVIVFVDQLGRIHDNYRWKFITEQFLGLVPRIRFAAASNIVFVLGLRPEHEGTLKYHLNREILSEQHFASVDLYPFTFDEGVKAILKRDDTYMTHVMATQIVGAVETDGKVEPYAVQLGAMAVWRHLYGGPTEQRGGAVDLSKIADLVRDGYAVLIQPLTQEPIQWEILKLLAFHPGGLTPQEISRRLQPLGTTLDGVKEALDDLTNQAGYRLLTIAAYNKNLVHQYTIAHDLLRDHILSYVSETEQEIERARKTLENGIWHYQARSNPLTSDELELIWKWQDQLEFTEEAWVTIVYSEVHSKRPTILSWAGMNHEAISRAMKTPIKLPQDKESLIRFRLLESYLFFNYLSGLTYLAQIADNEEFGMVVTDGLIQIGEPALEVLSDLARKAKNWQVRMRAAEGLTQIGEPALEVLSDLARKAENWEVQRVAAEGLTQIGEPALEVLSDLTKHDNERLRIKAAEGLTQIGEHKITLEVLSDLAWKAKNWQVRMKAVEGLTQIGEPALEVLSDLARKAENLEVQRVAAEGLTQIGEPALEVLSDLARKAENWEVQRVAAEGLTQIGEHEIALEVLSDLAQKAGNWQVRMKAVEGLTQIGEPALEVLSDLAQKAGNWQVRMKAVEGLTQIGALAVEVPISLVKHDNERLRMKAVEGLTQIGEHEIALEVLSDLAQKAENWEVQRVAAEGLIQIGEPALEVLSDLARKAENWEVQRVAAEGLIQIGEPALEVLSDLAQKAGNWQVRMKAVEGLTQIGEPALEVLSDLARKAENWQVQARAAEGLTQIGEPALEVLSDLARKAENWQVQARAAEGLTQIGEPALEVLSDLARKAENWEVQRVAAEGLTQIGEPALEVLSDLARKAKYELGRVRAVEGLVQIGAPAIEALIDLARNAEDAGVRVRAVEGLVQIGAHDPAREVLIDLARNAEDAGVRVRAAEGLVQIGAHDPAREVLIDLARNAEDAGVRVRAVEGLAQIGERGLTPLLQIAWSLADDVAYSAALGMLESITKVNMTSRS